MLRLNIIVGTILGQVLGNSNTTNVKVKLYTDTWQVGDKIYSNTTNVKVKQKQQPAVKKQKQNSNTTNVKVKRSKIFCNR